MSGDILSAGRSLAVEKVGTVGPYRLRCGPEGLEIVGMAFTQLVASGCSCCDNQEIARLAEERPGVELLFGFPVVHDRLLMVVEPLLRPQREITNLAAEFLCCDGGGNLSCSVYLAAFWVVGPGSRHPLAGLPNIIIVGSPRLNFGTACGSDLS